MEALLLLDDNLTHVWSLMGRGNLADGNGCDPMAQLIPMALPNNRW